MWYFHFYQSNFQHHILTFICIIILNYNLCLLFTTLSSNIEPTFVKLSVSD